MDRPLFVDNRHVNLVDLLSRQNPFFQAMFAEGGNEPSRSLERMLEQKDEDFSKFLIGIYAFTKRGIEEKLDHPIYDYDVVSRSALDGFVASTSWPSLPMTFFIAGAYIQHHLNQPVVEWSPDNMVIWFFTDFVARSDNDRFITRGQKRVLAGPSEYPTVSLIVRLLWQAANPRSAAVDADSVTRWFRGFYTAPVDKSPLLEVQLAPRPIGRDDARGEAKGTARDFDMGSLVDFGQHGNAERFKLVETWNPTEADFCWGRSPVALFAFTLQEQVGPATLDVDLIARDSQPGNVNRMGISCNGRTIFDRRDVRSGRHRVCVPLADNLRVGRYTNILAFHAPLFRPSDYAGDDNRDLGVAVQRLWIHGWA